MQVRLICFGILGPRPPKTREDCLKGNVQDNAVNAHLLEMQERGRVGIGENGTADTDETPCTGNC